MVSNFEYNEMNNNILTKYKMMKYIVWIVSIILTINFSFTQTLNKDNLIGQKVQFLEYTKDAKHYTSIFSKNIRFIPFLDYTEYKGRIATFLQKNENKYTLIMEDNKEIIYFLDYSPSELPIDLGFFSILDSAKRKYIGNVYYDDDINECKIINVKFPKITDNGYTGSNSYEFIYLKKNDTTSIKIELRENEKLFDLTEGFNEGFDVKNPFVTLTKLNIDEKFYIDIDKMENKKTYIHKNLANQSLIEYDLGYAIDYQNKAILTKVVVSNGIPKISFISNFYGDDWIFHSYIKIKIGEITKQTTPVKGKTEVFGGGVIETNYYSLPKDLEILKWIVDNYTKEITVRFYGKDYYEDISIPMTEKLAIKETYELYKMLEKK